MRTTLTIEDSIMQQLRERAHKSDRPLKHIINTTLELGLRSLHKRPRGPRYRLKTFSMGAPRAVNLDKALQAAAMLEDEEIVRKMEVRK